MLGIPFSWALGVESGPHVLQGLGNIFCVWATVWGYLGPQGVSRTSVSSSITCRVPACNQGASACELQSIVRRAAAPYFEGGHKLLRMDYVFSGSY